VVQCVHVRYLPSLLQWCSSSFSQADSRVPHSFRHGCSWEIFHHHLLSSGAGIAQSVLWLTTDWTTGVRSPTETEDFLLVSASRPALGPTQPLVQWVPGVVSPGTGRDADHSPSYPI
jgi:hypothetical protein